jgi:hypothetical protein
MDRRGTVMSAMAATKPLNRVRQIYGELLGRDAEYLVVTPQMATEWNEQHDRALDALQVIREQINGWLDPD